MIINITGAGLTRKTCRRDGVRELRGVYPEESPEEKIIPF
jgi:hypothetical protein